MIDVYSGMNTNKQEKMMSEINWDLAPEGAVEVQQDHESNLYWARGNGKYWDDGWRFSKNDGWKTIATRPQKTKTVADEGEKWTHYTGKGYKCKISLSEPDSYGSIVILSEHNVYIRCYPEDINPIKPKLTKAQAWDKLTDEDCEKSVSLSYLLENYEII